MKLGKFIEFEWDEGNSYKSADKHGVGNSEAEKTFFGFNIIIEDIDHSNEEKRYKLLGGSDDKILMIVFTERKNKVRIISSRIANKKERQIYKDKLNEKNP